MLRDLHFERHAAFRKQLEETRLAHAAALSEQIDAGVNSPELFIELARVRRELLQFNAARHVLEQGCERNGSPEVYVELIRLLADCNATDEAVAAASRARQLFPDRILFRFKAALTLPIVYRSPEHREDCRNRFLHGLAELESELRLDTPECCEDAATAIASHENFLLCYQLRNDREIQIRYSKLVRRILDARYPELMAFRQPAPDPERRRKRIGFLSPHLHRHSVSKAYAGWILGLNRETVETFVYHVCGPEEMRDDILRGAEHVRPVSGTLPEMCTAIRADQLDMLVFLDIGMHPVMTMLAAVRLAPAQGVTWGHPVTSGSPECDFFLSSELMEPADAERHYSERLIRLPGVGVCYPRPLIPRAILDPGRTRFGLSEERIVYLCSQATFKYAPEHDDLFVRIAREVPNAQFAFVAPGGPVAEAFRLRLACAFEAAGLCMEPYCVIIPFLDFFDYLGLTLAGDVYLDPPGFSGFNMALEAIACGLPVVTLPGEFLRGRLAFGALTQLGVTETIARDREEYVTIAARLGTDAEWRKEITRKMADQGSRLFSDPSSVAALERFLWT